MSGPSFVSQAGVTKPPKKPDETPIDENTQTFDLGNSSSLRPAEYAERWGDIGNPLNGRKK